MTCAPAAGNNRYVTRSPSGQPASTDHITNHPDQPKEGHSRGDTVALQRTSVATSVKV